MSDYPKWMTTDKGDRFLVPNADAEADVMASPDECVMTPRGLVTPHTATSLEDRIALANHTGKDASSFE
jgi:hypothetical protein